MCHKLPHFRYVAVKREFLARGMRPRSGPRCWTNGGGLRQVLLRMQRVPDRKEGASSAPGAPRACRRCEPPPRAPCKRSFEQHQAKRLFPGRGYHQCVGSLQELAHARLVEPAEQLHLLRDPQLCRQRVQLRAHGGLAGSCQHEPSVHTVLAQELGQRAVGHVRALLRLHPPHERDRGLLCSGGAPGSSSAPARERLDRSSPRGRYERVREPADPARRVAVPADRRAGGCERINLKRR